MKKKTVDSVVTENILNLRLSVLENKIDNKFEKFGREMNDKAREYRDDILNKMDEVMGELAQMREDKEIGEYQVKERLDDHEKRITKLETTPKAQ